MGNKQANNNVQQAQRKQQGKVVNESQKNKNVQKTGCGCFGGRKPSKSSGNANNIDENNRQRDIRSRTIHKAKKSQISVYTNPNANIDQNLFEGRQKQLIDIRLNRRQPYEILKDSDYFDSELDDKNDLNRLAKTYQTCQIANYSTPQIQKLQTVRVKTYLFDRNLTKIAA